MRKLSGAARIVGDVEAMETFLIAVQSAFAVLSSVAGPGSAEPDVTGPISAAKLQKAVQLSAEHVESLSVLHRQVEALMVSSAEKVHDYFFRAELDAGRHREHLKNNGHPDEASLEADALEQAKTLAASEVSCLTRLGEGFAHTLVTAASTLGALPKTRSGFWSGNITLGMAGLIGQGSEALAGEALEGYDQELASYVADADVVRSRRSVKTRVARVRAKFGMETQETRRLKELATRCVYLDPQWNGVVTMVAKLPAESAYAIYNTITDIALSAKNHGDARTMEQLRADALVGLFLTNSTTLEESVAAVQASLTDAMQAGGRPSVPREQLISASRKPLHKREMGSVNRAAEIVRSLGGKVAETQEGVKEFPLQIPYPPPIERVFSERVFSPSVHEVRPETTRTGYELGAERTVFRASPDSELDRKGAALEEIEREEREREEGAFQESAPQKSECEETGRQETTCQETETQKDSAGTATRCATGVGLRAVIHVYVPAATLVGESEEPATLAGYGPLTPTAARRLAARADTLYRILTDPDTGKPLAQGRKAYKVSQQSREYLTLLSETCEFPCCSVSSRRTDADHIVPWDSGGETDPENLQLLCRKHHNLKTKKGWDAVRNPDGTTTWLSPLGNTFSTRKEPFATGSIPDPAAQALSESEVPPF